MDVSQGRVVPQRVRDTLDTLAEGVVILNKEGEIVMANHSFALATGCATTELEGHKVSDLAWSKPVNMKKAAAPFPWEVVLSGKESQTGVILNLKDDDHASVLAVNSMPILGDDGSLRGALASFDNLTTIEKKNADLRQLLHKLRRSKVKIQRQNEHLHKLATKDPLTGCWNRRYFFEAFVAHWAAWERHGKHLCCVMIDIDHFKAVNDNMAQHRRQGCNRSPLCSITAPPNRSDLSIRGEEFCVLLPNRNSRSNADRRTSAQAIESLRPVNLPVTASPALPASTRCREHQALMEQADNALYTAKRTGRNKVVNWRDAVVQKSDHNEERWSSKSAPTSSRAGIHTRP